MFSVPCSNLKFFFVSFSGCSEVLFDGDLTLRGRQDFNVTLYRKLSYLIQGTSKSPRWALKWGHHRNAEHDGYNLKWRSVWNNSTDLSLGLTWIGLAITREENFRPTQTLLQSVCEIFHPQTQRRRDRTKMMNKSRRLLYPRNDSYQAQWSTLYNLTSFQRAESP